MGVGRVLDRWVGGCSYVCVDVYVGVYMGRCRSGGVDRWAGVYASVCTGVYLKLGWLHRRGHNREAAWA